MCAVPLRCSHCIYTSDCRCSTKDALQVKFSDDTSMTGPTTSKNSRRCAVDKLVGCCNDYHLLLNVSKTKEIAVDFKRDSSQRVKTHRCAVKKLVGWGKDYHLLFNVSKTEETVFAFRRDPTQLPDHLSSTKRKQRSWAPTSTPSWTGPRTQGQRQPPPFQRLQDLSLIHI